MAGNTFGKVYQLHSFGESHGKAIGGIIDGFPSNFRIDISKVKDELKRRKTNQNKYSSSRKEEDELHILSGIFEGKTIGTPIGFSVENNDAKSNDYTNIKDIYRPSHADFTWENKFKYRDYRGGGRSSARETISRIVAGAFAKQYLETLNVKIIAWVQQIANVECNVNKIPSELEVENSILRCPDSASELQMQKAIDEAAANGDTLGGIIHCHITGLDVGFGEPVFDKLNAVLAHAMLSINAVKGFEFGSGFQSAKMKASERNDEFIFSENKVKTKTNFDGGIQGGISNGQDIYFNVAFKPVSSIKQKQTSLNNEMEKVDFEIKGRHDVCVVPRAVPIVEAMAAITLLDMYLQQKINN